MSLGQAFAVELTFELKVPVDDAVLELGITAADGTRVVTVQNIDFDRPPLHFEPGLHEVRVAIDTTLLPGEFSIDIGVHRFIGLTLDQVEHVLTFTAMNTAIDSGDHWPWPEVRGSVRPGSDWAVRSAQRPGSEVVL